MQSLCLSPCTMLGLHATYVLAPKTSDKASISDSFPPHSTKMFYLAFLLLTLLQIVQTTFNSLITWLNGPIHSKNTLVTIVEFKRKKKEHILSVWAPLDLAKSRSDNWVSQVDTLIKVKLKSTYRKQVVPTENKRLDFLVTCQPKDANIVGLGPQ